MSARTRAVRRHSTQERSPRPAPPGRRIRRRVSSLRAVPQARHGWGGRPATGATAAASSTGRTLRAKTTGRPARHVERVMATTPADGEQMCMHNHPRMSPHAYTLRERRARGMRRRTCTRKRQSDKATKRQCDNAAKRQSGEETKPSVTGGDIRRTRKRKVCARHSRRPILACADVAMGRGRRRALAACELRAPGAKACANAGRAAASGT